MPRNWNCVWRRVTPDCARSWRAHRRTCRHYSPARCRHETLNALYYELRFLEEATQHTPDATAAVYPRSRRSIEQSSLPRDRIEDALATLATYEQLAETIAQTETLIQEKLATLAGLGNSVEPNLVTLLAAVNTESGRARLQIEQTRQMAVQMLVGAVIAGVLLALAVAAVLHATVTRAASRA